jgi:putative tryptophan/tyrosine transport system substrate-binding protein
MMSRRDMIGVLAGSAVLTWPFAVRPQQVAKLPRIGVLLTGAVDRAGVRVALDGLRQGLNEHGYIEGSTISIEYREAAGNIERLPDLASELVRLKVDVIVAGATPAARAAQRATATIPIVAFAMGDPVQDGLVASLGRPSGNVTGTTFLGPELVPKRLALLKEALPDASRIAILWHPGAFSERTMQDMHRETQDVARKLGMQLQLVPVGGADEFGRAFEVIAGARAEALFQFPSSLLFNERNRIVQLCAMHRLPAMFNAREFVEHGGLMAYGVNLTGLARRAAAYVDKILKGAKPAELPVEQPTQFELLINLRTAGALGITIPPAFLARADEVIE